MYQNDYTTYNVHSIYSISTVNYSLVAILLMASGSWVWTELLSQMLTLYFSSLILSTFVWNKLDDDEWWKTNLKMQLFPLKCISIEVQCSIIVKKSSNVQEPQNYKTILHYSNWVVTSYFPALPPACQTIKLYTVVTNKTYILKHKLTKIKNTYKIFVINNQ